MRHILAFIFMLASFCSFGQRYSFVEYSTEIGLPQSQVNSIAQDDQGYLWIGTLGGLAKFNGKEFTSYTRDEGLANNNITSLKFQDGLLWIGHEGGLSQYSEGKFKRWYLPNDSKNIPITQIVRFGKKIIVGTNGAGLFELTDTGLSNIKFNAEESHKIRDIEKYKDTYFIATRNGVYSTKDFRSYDFLKETDTWSVSDLELYNDQICITSFQDGIHLYDPKKNQLSPILLDPDFYPASSFADEKGKLWISAAEGIIVFDGKNIEFINEERGMPLVAINRIFEDDENNIWVGSAGKGLICFSGSQFVHHNLSTGLPSDLIIDVNQDKKGRFWISTFNKGLVMQKTDGKFVNIHDDVLTFWCSAMQVDGLNWFGTDIGLLSFRDTELIQSYTDAKKLPGYKTTTLHKVSATKMYIGGSYGLVLYDKGGFQTIHDNDNWNIGTIRDIDENDDNLYLATDKGFYIYKDGKIRSIDNFSKTTFCLIKDNYNHLWLGTEEGLYIYENGKVVNRNFSNETAAKFINFLNFSEDKLYIGTNQGLYSYAPDEAGNPKRIEHFGIQEGVVNLETNLNSSFVDNMGRLWFGTTSGLVIYDEIPSSDLKKSPRLILNGMLLNFTKTDHAEALLGNEMSFSYTKNNISFNFDGISFSNPKDVSYQFWLEGAEETWEPETFNPSVNYTRLRPGTYILHARAVGPQQNFSKEILIPFEIRSPFYQTWWFLLLCALAAGYLVYSFIRFRLHREREKADKEKIEIKNKLMALEQQSLNASMNRHFIFNSLNSIQFFINTQDRISANKYLTNFAQLIRKNLDASTSEDNLLAFSKEIERLKLYLSLESMRFKDKFDYSFEIDVPEAESIRIPSMLLQPYIENCIVHGVLAQKEVKGLIKTKAWTEGNVLFIQIEDNGIGISKSLKSKANFDGDHKSQGVEITAKRISLIKQMGNQGFEIIGPQDIIDENRSINGTYVLLKIPFENLER